jgi:hypothetical protein
LRRLRRFILIGVCGVSAAGCGQHGTTLHSVRAVQGTFARHGVKLAAIERSRVSTMLVPAAVARAWRATPALARPRARAKYFVIVFTDRRWLHDLSRHRRQAERTIGAGRVEWSQTSSRRDNVFIAYPAGPPTNIERLRRILDDI